RHAMRQSRSWEVIHQEHTNREWANMIHIPERMNALDQDLSTYLSKEELQYVMTKNNKQAALLYLHSQHIQQLKTQGLIWEFSFFALENVLQEFFTLKG